MARILVVDDEQSIRTTFSYFLKKEKHDVYLAEGAEEAIEIMKSTVFDLVLTDIILPHKTGMEVLKKAKEMDYELPVIIMTGEPTTKTSDISRLFGASEYLVKPIVKDELLQAVSASLKDSNQFSDKNWLQLIKSVYTVTFQLGIVINKSIVIWLTWSQ